MSREGSAAFRRALGLDYKFIARWVAAHERACECNPRPEIGWTGRCPSCAGRAVEGYQVSQIANNLSGEDMQFGDAKAAITMRYAKKEGFAERRVTDEGDIWLPTPKAYEWFPPDKPHVMPESEPAVITGKDGSPVGTFQAMDAEDIRRETDAELQRQVERGEKPELPPGE